MPEIIRPEFIEPALTAKTKASVLRQMVALAEKTGRVCDPRALLEGLEAREELCSTGIPGGLALLHTRNPEPYLFETAFLALGRTIQQIPFGAPDGQPTNLFFLIGMPGRRHAPAYAGPPVLDGAENRPAGGAAPSHRCRRHVQLHHRRRASSPGPATDDPLIRLTEARDPEPCCCRGFRRQARSLQRHAPLQSRLHVPLRWPLPG